MASLPRLPKRPSDGDNIAESEIGAGITPNLRKLRHIKSIEINHRMEEAKRPFKFADDQLIAPKQRLNQFQSKSTFNLRNKVTDSRRVISSNNATAGLFIGKAAIVQDQLNLQHEYLDKYQKTFYTLNNFMDFEKPYFISRVFDKFSVILDPLELQMNDTSFTINLYRKSNKQWHIYRQYHIKMSLLICIGDDLESVKQRIDYSNMIIFQLSDDCYYSLPNEQVSADLLKAFQLDYSMRTQELLANVRIREQSCTYDQMMKLNNFSRCIHDLMVSNKELEMRIASESKVEEFKVNSERVRMDTSQTKFLTDELFNRFEKIKMSNHSLANKLKELQDVENKRLMVIDRNNLLLDPKTFQNIKLEYHNYEIKNRVVTCEINKQKARVASTVMDIFKIEQLKSESSRKIEFQMYGIKLPSALSLSFCNFRSIFSNGANGATKVEIVQRLSQLSTGNLEKLNFLVGLIAFIIHTLGKILRIKLRYPIRFLGSHTYIHNPISSIKAAVRNMPSAYPYENPSGVPPSNSKTEVYPLFAGHNASICVRFLYSMMLLKKDLAQLFEVNYLTRIESFNLLASLKIFLTCISSFETDPNKGQEDASDESNITQSGLGISIDLNRSTSTISASPNITSESSPVVAPEISTVTAIHEPKSLNPSSGLSKNVEDFNNQIHSEERFNLIKSKLRQYAK